MLGFFIPRPNIYGIGDDTEKDVEGTAEEVEIGQRTPSEGENGVTEIEEFELLDEDIPVQVDPVTGKLFMSVNLC